MNNYLIIGGCGTGKTWIMKQLIKDFQINESRKEGLYHYSINQKYYVVVLGKYDGTMFEGSDRLAMNIMADNEKMVDVFSKYCVIAEGDRFTNSTYIAAFKPIILRIKGDGAEGRAKRNSQQTERHTKAIATRVNNILPHFEFANSQECLNFVENELADGERTAAPYKSNIQTLF
jgi:hypothetical protein